MGKISPITVRDAHRIMVQRIIDQSSVEAVLDLVSDCCLARAGNMATRPTISQMRYRDLGAPLGAAIAAAAKRHV